ncbi:MAG: L-serine dehydratase, partial [Caballeronia sp.]|nr:L-serine dehydratase [Caballeronia sp.]
MAVSVFDLFKIGIGPSSSHTVGPMRAALMFVQGLERDGLLDATATVKCELYGSLGATGKGHGTDRGVMLGLMGDAPDTVDAGTISTRLETVRATKKLPLLGRHEISFVLKEHIVFLRQALAEHPNGMKLHAFDASGMSLRDSTYLSVGGGFVVTAGASNVKVLTAIEQLPYAFQSGDELLALCRETGKSVAQLMWENERVWRSEDEIRSGLLRIWEVMQSCVKRGCGIDNPDADGCLPGPFQVKRRAPVLYRALVDKPEQALRDPLSMIDWINLYAIAVNEENAVGG